jgi:hypothetical protein
VFFGLSTILGKLVWDFSLSTTFLLNSFFLFPVSRLKKNIFIVLYLNFQPPWRCGDIEMVGIHPLGRVLTVQSRDLSHIFSLTRYSRWSCLLVSDWEEARSLCSRRCWQITKLKHLTRFVDRDFRQNRTSCVDEYIRLHLTWRVCRVYGKKIMV